MAQTGRVHPARASCVDQSCTGAEPCVHRGPARASHECESTYSQSCTSSHRPCVHCNVCATRVGFWERILINFPPHALSVGMHNQDDCCTEHPVEQCTDQIDMHTPRTTSAGVGTLQGPREIERRLRFSTPKRGHCEHARWRASQYSRYGQGWTSRIRKINAAAGGPWGKKVRRTSAQPVPAACTRRDASSRSPPPSGGA